MGICEPKGHQMYYTLLILLCIMPQLITFICTYMCVCIQKPTAFNSISIHVTIISRITHLNYCSNFLTSICFCLCPLPTIFFHNQVARVILKTKRSDHSLAQNSLVTFILNKMNYKTFPTTHSLLLHFFLLKSLQKF